MAKDKNIDQNTVSYYKGDVIFKENDKPEFAYLIKRGAVQTFCTINDKKEITSTLKPGQIFGEIEIIKGGRRTYGAEAIEFSNLVKIDRGTLKVVYKESLPIVKTLIEGLAESVKTYQKEHVTLKHKEKIADHFIALGKASPAVGSAGPAGGGDIYLMKKTYHVGETIYKEGETGNCAYRITKGIIELFKYEQDHNALVETLKEGDMFGELETITGTQRPFTAKAKEICELEKIDRPTLKNLVKDSHPVIKDLTRKIVQRLNTTEKNTFKARLLDNPFLGFSSYLHLLATKGDDSFDRSDDHTNIKVKGRAAMHQEKLTKKIKMEELEKDIKDVLMKLRALKLIEIELPAEETETPDAETIIAILDARRFLRKTLRSFEQHIENEF